MSNVSQTDKALAAEIIAMVKAQGSMGNDTLQAAVECMLHDHRDAAVRAYRLADEQARLEYQAERIADAKGEAVFNDRS